MTWSRRERQKKKNRDFGTKQFKIGPEEVPEATKIILEEHSVFKVLHERLEELEGRVERIERWGKGC